MAAAQVFTSVQLLLHDDNMNNRNDNYQDVNMSRTANMQANLQIELLQFPSKLFFTSQCKNWSCELAFSTPESNNTPGFKGKVQDIPWREGSVFEKKPLRHST